MDFLRDGIISGKGDYGVNGWIVEHEQSIEEFYNQYNTPIQKGPRIVVIDNKSNEIVRLPKKAEFLPREPKYTGGENLNNSLYAFIINPINNEDSIVNERLGLDHAQRQYKEASSIPIGVPKNAISGILISKELINNEKKIKEIIELFPEQYVTTPEGELIYEPNKDKNQQLPISSNIRKNVENIATSELFRNVQEISSEITKNYTELEKPVETKGVETKE